MSGSLSKVLSFLSFLSLFSTWIICVFGGQGLTLDLIKKNLVQFLKSQSNTCTPSLNSITTNKKMQSLDLTDFGYVSMREAEGKTLLCAIQVC